MDFLYIATKVTKKGHVDVYPKFKVMAKSSDLMIRGRDFYAVWVEEEGRWSTDEGDVIAMVDKEIDKYLQEHDIGAEYIRPLYMWDAESGMIDRWHKYCQKQMRDNYHMLDEKIIFANDAISKKDYASKRLPYALEEGSIDAYEELMNVLYSPDERKKLEWAIGAIVSGDSKKIQKFLVLYGSAGTGKSTVLNIIQQLFEGYFCVFDAKALGSVNNNFALEAFRSNPLVAIQHDGDLSRIEDNTRLNSLVSHEIMTVNEKFKATYENRFKAFLFMGTNKPVRITDAKSGLIRRLIDVSPTGNTIPTRTYQKLIKQIEFELGAIAYHCLQVYEEDPGLYDSYIPVSMLGASNDFYNFVIDSYYTFKKEDKVPLKQAWDMYKAYVEEAKINYPFSQRVFKEELKNYFEDYDDIVEEDGTKMKSVYSGFKTSIFKKEDKRRPDLTPMTLIFDKTESLLDTELADCYAQYAKPSGTPMKAWDKVKTKLSSIDTHELHYVKMPENHIVIDFDIPNSKGEKDLLKNIEAASKFPPTYAELSKSGMGIHLHYIYTGDTSMLNPIYADHIEVKVQKGNSSLRRKLTKCNDLPIATISSGLPLKEKGEKDVINMEGVGDEKHLRNLIAKALRKEIPPGATKTSIDFIVMILDEAYNKGLAYDVSDMYQDIFQFANDSSHNAEYCIKQLKKMKLASEKEPERPTDEVAEEAPIAFYDIEVFPNLFLVNWKHPGPDQKVVRMINPEPKDIGELMKMRLIGFNCRRYDNHIIFARWLGKSIEALYDMSHRIVSGSSGAFIREAYNVSYTDAYDFCSTKQSLKKWEIEINRIVHEIRRLYFDKKLSIEEISKTHPAHPDTALIERWLDPAYKDGLKHKELGLPWDKPVDKSLWTQVAEYCDNDVIATEEVFYARQPDFTARRILADVAGLTVNDTTNSLTTRIIFGKERNPQAVFNYRFMGDQSKIDMSVTKRMIDESGLTDLDKGYTVFNAEGRPVFPGYTFDYGVSKYRNEEVGEGGYVYAEPGIYTNVALLDIASMHPSSIVAENLFGDEYTGRFKEILDSRLLIKHKEFSKAKNMLGGKLEKYLSDPAVAKDLAQALKIAINSVYGLTAAKFVNPFRDPDNTDNIVAKRGALFMVNLKHEVQKRGFTVAHIKTDSIKIPNATPEIIDFVMRYGKMYGYNFEHEATYDRMCLVNDAVYIAKYDNGEWTATGTQFQVPYVFKTLFSHEPITFEDMCETKSVSQGGDIFIDMNEDLPDVSDLEDEYKKLDSKYRKGDINDSTWEKESSRLVPEIAKGHDYIFVGRVGQFCPIKPGKGGGALYRCKDGKYYSLSGTKDYRWLESEVVLNSGKEKDIDELYYKQLCADAIAAIEQYDSFNAFVSDEPFVSIADQIRVEKGTEGEREFKG